MNDRTVSRWNRILDRGLLGLLLIVGVCVILVFRIPRLDNELRAINSQRKEVENKVDIIEQLEKGFREAINQRNNVEQAIVDVLRSVREVGDIPQVKSEFIIHHAGGLGDKFLSWIIVPAGKHELLLDYQAERGGEISSLRFPLLENAGYCLAISSTSKEYDTVAPMQILLTSNSKEFKPIQQVLAAESTNSASYSSRNPKTISFPSQRQMFAMKWPAVPPPESKFQAEGVTLWDIDKHFFVDGKERYITFRIAIRSEAPECVEPAEAYSQLSILSPYNGNGRFEVKK